MVHQICTAMAVALKFLCLFCQPKPLACIHFTLGGSVGTLGSCARVLDCQGVILVSICGGDIGEVTHTPHFCKIKSTKVPECTQCTMEVTRYTAKAKFKSTSELLIT